MSVPVVTHGEVTNGASSSNKVPVNLISPWTCKVLSGSVVPTPTLLFTASTWKVFVSTVTFEEMYELPVT